MPESSTRGEWRPSIAEQEWPVVLAETLDPTLESFVDGSGDPATDFPIQNLPLGSFSTHADQAPRLGVAIGGSVLDLKAVVEAGVLGDLPGEVRCALSAGSLNDYLRLGRPRWIATRLALSRLLRRDSPTLRDRADRDRLLRPRSAVRMHVPARIGDYTDFYASLHHATNVGSMFRPDNPLMPNWKHLPVGYHGRASSIIPSGMAVRRPHGQVLPPTASSPIWSPTRSLDYELELGFLVGPGNPLGRRIPVAEAIDHLHGIVLVNDWSARDVQAWEYQPLGPFNAKNFATSVSPWVVSFEALAPFLVAGPPRAADDPAPLAYLVRPDDFLPNLQLEVALSTSATRRDSSPSFVLSRGGYGSMYWSPSQMVAHHTSTGCNLQPGDLLASGTISGPNEESRGCLLERTWRGKNPLRLPDGSERSFLLDGDEVVMRGWCERPGFRRIGLGECRGEVLPAE
ncbi:MAG: fumarylacetoacetase [Phycisphaerae bacterium]|nr:fumarylacetoacetase [Phycisphaerae bacterium]